MPLAAGDELHVVIRVPLPRPYTSLPSEPWTQERDQILWGLLASWPDMESVDCMEIPRC